MLKTGVTVEGADLRIGLTADDQMASPALMRGEGFEKLASNTYVFSSAEDVGGGTLEDGENVWAAGTPESLWDLRGEVLASPSPGGIPSVAQVAQLAVSDLKVDRPLPDSRLVIETDLMALVGMNASAICKVEAELNYDGALMGRIVATYHLYGTEGGKQVEIYRGPRGQADSKRVAVIGAGETHAVTDPSFYFDLGPGPHELEFSMSVRVSSGSVLESSTASVAAGSRLRLE